MTARERIIAALRRAGEAICDDCMVAAASLSARQVSYSTCTNLAAQGQIVRETGLCSHCGKVKIVSSADPAALPDYSRQATPRASAATSPPATPARHSVCNDGSWHWEGNVQACLVAWLVGQGYAIRSVADTRSRAAGKDIIAVGADGKELWVSVKGYAAAHKHPHTQARHYFSEAVFDALLYRDGNPDVDIAVAFPGEFGTYRALAKRVGWLRASLPLTIYWVMASGEVIAE